MPVIYIVEDDQNIQEIELFALKNSGYQGDFVYESAQPLKCLPDDNVLRMEFMKYTVKLGRYLLAME